MSTSEQESVRARFDRLVREWRVTVGELRETSSSLFAFGERDSMRVVLKVIHSGSDEWCSGRVLRAFAGPRYVRVLEETGGAVLMERIAPATPLTELVDSGHDDEALDILAEIACQPTAMVDDVPSVRNLADSFDRYLQTDDRAVPEALVARAQQLYRELSESQKTLRLLHGDLQHTNVLLDEQRGWTVVDPKGLVGELAFEAWAVLRNPPRHLALMSDAKIVEQRARRFASQAALDLERVLQWTFAGSVLSLVWTREDGFAVDQNLPALRLAESTWQLIATG